MDSYLPAHISPDDVQACIGLISDTHIPFRWRDVPAAVGEALAGVELILHAGDGGELWALDRLSRIAPVVAVHGNDDAEEAMQQLPFQQVVAVAGRRILLWHGHYPDRSQELAARKLDSWQHILERSGRQAQVVGAEIAVLGHLHVPFARQYEGVWVMNPGAIASGNYVTRQRPQTVARLYLLRDGTVQVTHVALGESLAMHRPVIAWERPFSTALAEYTESIVAPGLEETAWTIARRLYDHDRAALEVIMGAVAFPCWEGEREVITAGALVEALHNANGLPPAEVAYLTSLLPAD